jgi:3-hydroxybutyryl-CoA dehydratase
MMRGRLFEEFEPGEVLETAGRTITEADVVMFAGLSGDYTELHTNEEFARRTPFGRRIAHGALVFSVSIGLTTRTNVLDGTIVAFSRVDSLRFTRPVFIGDTIRVSKRLVAAEVKTPETGMLAFDTRVVNQDGQTVLAFVDRLLVRRRSAAGAESMTRVLEAAVIAT